MKTPDEIKKVLECRSRALNDECNLECKSCDVYVHGRFPEIFREALAYIQQLEETVARYKERHKRLLETASILSDAVDELEQEG